jgi:CDP-paratose 2-epimerase
MSIGCIKGDQRYTSLGGSLNAHRYVRCQYSKNTLNNPNEKAFHSKQKLYIRAVNERILITGGCGFVGSHLALQLKFDFPTADIIAMDNLKRRGAELNIPRLQDAGIRFIHGDIRNPEDFNEVGEISTLVEAAAEPSVLSGIHSTPDYVLNTNLTGTIHCLNFAQKNKARVIFLSTSRVYPIEKLCALSYTENDTRFQLQPNQVIPGVSPQGISENFPLDGARSFYGTSKLASELLIQEYGTFYNIPYIINRCGVLTGPWQMGKIDQGVVVLWLAMHYWKKPLSYIGFGGAGKQVRDILHIADLYRLIKMQLLGFEQFQSQVFNVGGGLETSLSLQEMTTLCEQVTGNKITIQSNPETRPADIPLYLTNNDKITSCCGWAPSKKPEEIFTEIFQWMREQEHHVKKLLTS